MTEFQKSGPTRLIDALEQNAREIDQTFAKAGRELGDGLALFGALTERLNELSTELSGERLTSAGEALARVAQELRKTGPRLRAESSALQQVAQHSHDVSALFGRLIKHMRLMTILSRSARIEAVSVPNVGRDSGDFTNEIAVLAERAKATVEDCEREHARLDLRLTAGLAAQAEFQGRYGAALEGLADALDAAAAEVGVRQHRGAELTRTAALHSGKIAQTATGAIIALQSGDSIRQRLEHAIAALHLGAELAAGQADWSGSKLGRRAGEAAGALLDRLAGGQLRATASALAEDAEAIEVALALLSNDTSGLLHLVDQLYRGDSGDSASFLSALEANLARAGETLVQCNNARVIVESVTATLSDVLTSCDATVATLARTVATIELIGTNAGLRAARVGSHGRSLVVIAQELKLASDLIARDARRLAPAFSAMQTAASELRADARPDSSRISHLREAMQASLEDCPSSDNLRPFLFLRNGGSGSSGFEVMRPAADAASVSPGWSGA